MNKSELRKLFKTKRNTLDIDNLSEKIVNNLFELDVFINAKNICTYISFGNEINTQKILNLKNKNIYAPKIINDKIIMVKYNPNNLSQNKYSILEPINNEIYLPQEQDVIVVPALSCDKNFNRLGYGGGFYDEYLKNTNSVKVSLLPNALLSDNLPTEPHDKKIDIIITETDIFKQH